MKRLLTAIFLVATSSCSGVQTPAAALKEAVEDYTRSMRWGHIERAATHVPDALRPAWVRQHRLAQAEMQIHEYDVRAVEHTIGTDRARVIVLAVWSRPADPVVHQELMAQEWNRNSGVWVMTSQTIVKAPQPTATPVSPMDGL